ncbi:putative pentatricopeptide repeat-containing protein At1g53330 [Malus sylvestris]|uniref:putative pentatricopeptide repeat-containing protein At1g53330 n=1 Tax=Malus sylvestris TaxID=3752 RepID=UPI0021AC370F|nr:putative pentatricopeptide repeat-containing protein At1g53330 [Malus sylvestris]
MFDRMEQVLHQMNQETRFYPPEIIFCNVISFYGRARLPDRALQVFDEIPAFRCQRTAKSLNSLLDALFKLKEAFKLKYDMVVIHGVVPNLYVLKEEMATKKIKPDSAVNSTLISGLYNAGRKEEVSGLLDEMRLYGCKPDTVTFNALIHGLCKEKNFEAAYRVLDEMAEKGCEPDVISYNTIIGGLCKEGKWREANDLLEDLPRRRCTPDFVSYRTMYVRWTLRLETVQRSSPCFGRDGLQGLRAPACKYTETCRGVV